MSFNVRNEIDQHLLNRKSNSQKIPVLRVTTGLCGPILLGLGSGISISAGFGAFGFSVLLDGIYQLTNLPLWLSQIIITLLFYLIAWTWARIPLGIGTLPSLLLIGPTISLGATITPDNVSHLANLVAFTVGLVLFAVGISMAAAAALGPDGITAVSLAAEKKSAVPVPKSNLILNLTAITLGISFGGNFGPATIVGLFVVPVLIGQLLPVIRASFNQPRQIEHSSPVFAQKNDDH